MKPIRPTSVLILTGLLLVSLPVSACGFLPWNSPAQTPTPVPTGPVTADFYASPNPRIGKGWVTFVETATGAAKYFHWDLDGDGEFDDAVGRQARDYFNTNGYFTIGLRVRGTDGSEDSIIKWEYLEVSGCTT